jgi:hypothetical protein
MADDFTRRKLDWLDQVSRDLSVSHAGFRLAYALSGHFNRGNGEAWPKQATLATAIGVSDRTVRTLTEELASQGHLTVESGRGRHQSNRFSMTVKNRKSASALSDGESRKPTSGFGGLEDRKPTSGLGDENRKPASVFGARKPEVQRTKTGSLLPKKPEAHFRQNTLNEHTEEHTEEIPSKSEVCHPGKSDSEKRQPNAAKKAKPKASETAFETWWALYPKKAAKKSARIAFDRAIGAGKIGLAELMHATTRYAETCDRRFYKNPDGWLNGERWADESSAPAQPKAPPPLNRHAAVGGMSAIAGILGEDDF